MVLFSLFFFLSITTIIAFSMWNIEIVAFLTMWHCVAVERQSSRFISKHCRSWSSNAFFKSSGQSVRVLAARGCGGRKAPLSSMLPESEAIEKRLSRCVGGSCVLVHSLRELCSLAWEYKACVLLTWRAKLSLSEARGHGLLIVWITCDHCPVLMHITVIQKIEAKPRAACGATSTLLSFCQTSSFAPCRQPLQQMIFAQVSKICSGLPWSDQNF